MFDRRVKPHLHTLSNNCEEDFSKQNSMLEISYFSEFYYC